MKKILIKVVVLLFIVNGLCLSYLGLFDSKAVDYVYTLTSEGDVIGTVDEDTGTQTVNIRLPENYYFDSSIEEENITLNLPSRLNFEIASVDTSDLDIEIDGTVEEVVFETLSIKIDGNFIYDDETTYQTNSVFCNDISIPSSIIYFHDGTISGSASFENVSTSLFINEEITSDIFIEVSIDNDYVNMSSYTIGESFNNEDYNGMSLIVSDITNYGSKVTKIKLKLVGTPNQLGTTTINDLLIGKDNRILNNQDDLSIAGQITIEVKERVIETRPHVNTVDPQDKNK